MPNNNIALMRNGIFKEGKSGKDDFIQYNDYFEHKSFFQCPKCLSLNVEDNHIYTVSKVVYVKKIVWIVGLRNVIKYLRRATMIKHILKLIFTLAMYELDKYVTEQLIIWCQSDDELDAPLDFTDADHAHLNRLMREVSE